MKRLLSAVVVSALTMGSVHAVNIPAQDQTGMKIDNVIYITLDGTRWQDIYVDRSHFPKLWGKYAKQLTFYGKPNSGIAMEAASTPVSLPSFQTQMAGKVQPHCEENDCGRIKVQTFPEYLIGSGTLSKTDVVTFASWNKMRLAVEHIPGTTTTYIGNYPVTDPITHIPDDVMAKLNAQQTTDHPELDPEDGPERFDKYTLAQALHYYEKYQPKFMWISLVDADEAGHANDKKAYNNALTLYDNAFDQLFTTLKTMNRDQNTLVIVTTDHGRGNGKNWVEHGAQMPESKQTWAFVMNGKLEKTGEGKHAYSTLSIRPTVEAAFKKSA